VNFNIENLQEKSEKNSNIFPDDPTLVALKTSIQKRKLLDGLKSL